MSRTRIRGWLGNVFFGWWIVGAAVLTQLLQAGLVSQAYGTYVVVWQGEFGWSTTALAAGFALMQVIGGLLSPAQGWLLQRFGVRAIVRLGLMLMGFGLVLLSRVDSLAGFYGVLLIIAAGVSLSGFLSLSTVVVNWFERRRAHALSLWQSGVSLGGFLVPLVAWSLTTFGWRPTALASGVLVLAASLPLPTLLRSRPEDFGLWPDGEPPRKPSPTASPPRELRTRQALRTRAFWFLAVGHGLALMVVSSVLVHLVAFLHEERGYALTTAAAMLALMTGFSIGGQLLGGYLGDRFSKRHLAGLAMLGHAAGLLTLAFAGTTGLVVVFALLHGVAWGVRGPLMMAIRADYFGRASFATVMGISSVFVMAGMMVGPLLVGALADTFGSYFWGFAALAAGALLGSLLFLAATPPGD